MAETVSPDSTNMEPNRTSVNSAAKADTIRQRVPLKKNKTHRLQGYVSPFLAEKSKIDAKFVNLQCVWRDLEQQRQLGKKAFKERQFDHKPRGKIKHKENYLNPVVTVKKEALSPDIPIGISRLLLLETQLDENDNELTPSTTTLEYRNVIHQRDREPIDSVFAIGNDDRAKENIAKQVDVNPSATATSTAKKTTTRIVSPLKLNTRNLRGRSVSTSSEDSVSPGHERSIKKDIKVTLTKPNSPVKVSSIKSDHSTKISLRSTGTVTQDKQVAEHGQQKHRSNQAFGVQNPAYELVTPVDSKPRDVRDNKPSPGFEGKKTTSVRIQLDSSFSEDDQQISPNSITSERKISIKSKAVSPEPKTYQSQLEYNKNCGATFKEEKSLTKSNLNVDPTKKKEKNPPTTRDSSKAKELCEENPNPSKTKELELPTGFQNNSRTTQHSEARQFGSKTNAVPVSVVVEESESDTEVKKTYQNPGTSSGNIRNETSGPGKSVSSASDFKKRRSIFENTDASLPLREPKQGKSSSRKLDTVGSPKRKIAAKLQNIQSNIHKIVTDIKQSKQATGHVRPSDESSHDTTEELNTVAVENSPLKTSPKAKNTEISNTEKDKDKQPKVQKDLETSAQKTSANTLVTEGSKRQEKSPVDTVTLDASRVDDSGQTLKGIRDSGGKLSDPMEIDKLTVMNTKRARNTSERRRKGTLDRKEGMFTNGHSNKTYSMGLRGLPNNTDGNDKDKNETTQEIVPLKGGGQKRIVRHRSSKGGGQDPEEVATDLQKSLLTSKKVIERQLTGILDKRIESDNLVGALKRSMTKPTAREKVAAATHEIHEIIQNGIIQEENGRKIYQVRVQMGPFTGDVNYTQDGHIVIIEGSTTESPIFTKEIKVEFPTQGLDMELLSVHSINAVVELNVPYLYVPSQDDGVVQNALDQYISDEVSALKREYLQPWIENNDEVPAATVTENSLVMPPSALSKYMTEDDMKQAQELEIKPGEPTKDVTITDLDDPKLPRVRTLPRPPKFAPPTPPQNGLETEEDKLTSYGVNGQKISRRHRRNTSLSSNASVSSADVLNSNNNSNQHSPGSEEQSPGDQTEVFLYGSNSLTRPSAAKPHRSRRNRHSITKVNQESSHNGNVNGSIGARNSESHSIEKSTLSRAPPDIQVTEASSENE